MKVKYLITTILLCCCTGAAIVSCSMTSKDKATATPAQEKYIDFEMGTPDGTLVKVSDFVSKNKYTLIDFWASWCGPCHIEMPNIVKAYDEYHEKGFEVVGISLDHDKGDWMRGISDLQIFWPQMSDLRGWENAGAQLYGIHAIPANVLVDQQGNVVAKNLRGEALLQKLAELF